MGKIVCTIEARLSSTRLPGKILLPLAGRPMLLRVVDRVLRSKQASQVVVATTTNPADEKIVKLLQGYHPKLAVFRGSEQDVLDRCYQAAKQFGADIVVKVTSDNPFIDHEVIDLMVEKFLDAPGLDFISNNIGRHTYPRGLDAEVFTFKILERLWQTTTEPLDREHVTIHIKRFPELFKTKNLELKQDYSHLRWTVDQQEDYELAKIIYERLLPKNPDFLMKDILDLYQQEPTLLKINQRVEQRNPQY